MTKTDRERREAQLRVSWQLSQPTTEVSGQVLYQMIRAAVRAALPGRQQARNLDPVLHEACRAGARVLMRRARS